MATTRRARASTASQELPRVASGHVQQIDIGLLARYVDTAIGDLAAASDSDVAAFNTKRLVVISMVTTFTDEAKKMLPIKKAGMFIMRLSRYVVFSLYTSRCCSYL